MVKHCKCNPHKTNNEFCDHCGKRLDQCVCDNSETVGQKARDLELEEEY